MCVIMTCFTSCCLCDTLVDSWNVCVHTHAHTHTYTLRKLASSTSCSGGALLEFQTVPITVHVHCLQTMGDAQHNCRVVNLLWS